MKKLKRRFILTAMVSMFLVLLLMIGGMNLGNYRNLIKNADLLTHMLADNDGVFPDNKQDEKTKEESVSEKSEKKKKKKKPEHKLLAETPFQTRYFCISYDENGQMADLSLEHIAAVGETKAKEYGEAVKKEVPDTGFYGIYRYRTTKTQRGMLCVFVDCEKDMETMKDTLVTSLIMSAAGLAAVFVLVCIFSTIVFRPVEEGNAKQKQFITDAGHELKTPLTIIEANTDIIGMEYGDSKWLQSTKNQVARMSALIQQLVTLARMDEMSETMQKQKFSFSQVVLETVELFYPAAESRGRNLSAEIEKDVFLCGDEKSVRQMLELLFDNALKYSLPKTEIKVELKKRGRKHIFLIQNACEPMEVGNQNILFERFYKRDVSRNSSGGGSGIGLSVVRSVAQAHDILLHAESRDGESFCIWMEL